MKNKFWIVALVLALAFALALTGCGGNEATEPNGNDNDAAEEEIVIGAVFGLTGDIATFGQSSKEAIEMAVEEVNAAGGVLGRDVKVIFEDNKSLATETALAVEKLIESDNVVSVIGAIASTNTLAGAPVAQDAQIPMVSGTSTNETVTQQGDYIFRACFIDPFQGRVAAQFALEDLDAKTAAILTDVGSDYSMGLRDVFEESFIAGGGEVVEKAEFVVQDVDFNSQLTLIKSKNPDVVFVPAYYNSVGLILAQAEELGIEATFIGTDGWDSPTLFDLAGEAANGHYFTNHYSPDADTPEVKQFIESYGSKYGGKTPDALAALAYDAFYMTIDAIERAGSTEGPAIRDALAETEGFVGVSGTITMDENRNPIKSAVIIEIKDQKQVYKTTVNP
ncbi:MAG: ABC transporter substrate-binding protein [Bacillota bacterium]|nr:ABC transporter substrate-binding protein [Bacillota bacterium]MDW7683410.1 ABC transporter substrate-binding protein [Bacillota bacterium]